ncbi:Ribosomal protein S33 [Cichlidogyrus casuarinus]|uniref:Small ribosomal subunit protein mS33 n=1 Tax=Cichlidogyrus casuarinus TaxID=1844966 RepID=A0ABD2Q4J7_9PLAT
MPPRLDTPYAKKMTQLAGRIFGDFGRPVDSKSRRILRITSQEPPAYKLKDYYAPVTEYEHILYKLRYLGLYRSEHADFQDEMKRLRELRGKGKRAKGQKKPE